jgi:hypothetical protein
VICTHLCTAERLAHSPRTRQNEWRARQSGATFRATRGWARASRHRIGTC